MIKDQFLNDLISNLEELFSKLNPQENIELFNKTGDNLQNLLTLGEIPKNMLQIGFVQEDLKKLGFDYEVKSANFKIINIDCLQKYFPLDHKYNSIDVRFRLNYAHVSQSNKYFYFNEQNWHKNLLDHVKKLIGDSNGL